ncbi:MAG TPA: hypothetical protein VF365_03515 [Candidatus Limnocylindria bacterium]
MTSDGREADRTLLVIGAGILALVIVAAAVVLVLGSREPTTFPADAPEGVVQRHLAAFEDGDFEAAYAYFSANVQSDMDLDSYERTVREYGGYQTGTSRRILFDRTDLDGDVARVHLTVEEYYGGGPFGGGETYRSTREIRLIREGGSWMIDDPLIGLEPAPFPMERFGP